MKEFYVLNLDYRRIAILTGGALVLLGLTLFLGMAIGRGQSERKLLAEAEAQKLGLAPEPAKAATENPVKVIADAPPAAVPIVEKKETPSAPAPLSGGEIPLREDPLVQGPPRKKIAPPASAETESPSPSPRRNKRRHKALNAEPEVSGQVNHAANVRYTIQVAAFKRASEAQNLVAKLKEEGIKARSEKSGVYYLVTVGRSKSKEKLAKALARLKELEYEAYIRKINKTSADT